MGKGTIMQITDASFSMKASNSVVEGKTRSAHGVKRKLLRGETRFS
jgi:hypothetical protein